MLVTVRTSVAANSSSTPLTGTQAEIMVANSQIEVAMVQQSGAVGDVLATVTSGSDQLAEEQPISAAAVFPRYPDDYSLTDVAAAGERLVIRLRNTTGGAIVVITTVKVTPL